KKSLGDGVPTMAELMARHGYEMAGFVTGPSLNHAMGFNRGFGFYDDFTVTLMHETNLFEDLDVEKSGVNQVPTNHLITRLAADWLRKHTSGKFFLFLHYWDCHNDYIPPAPYDRMFSRDRRAVEVGRAVSSRRAELERNASTAEKEGLVAQYDGEIAQTDNHVGKLLQALDELDLTARTIVFVLSDHGEGFWEHGKLLHGYGLYEELLHVPFILRMPGVAQAGLRVKGNVSHVDVLPTLFGLLGLPQPAGAHGLDLSAVCRGEAGVPSRPVFSEYHLAEGARSVRWGPWRMTLAEGSKAGELFFVKAGRAVAPKDAGASGEETAEASQALGAALTAGPGSTGAACGQAKPSNLDAKTERLLRSLGYVQ
ncbi:MAG TPA: sulfatase, partial [Candidatus Brocadiia bacterium]|nr:sulfatase [Candidatus Brocadiia bacterium]